jgi:hypothetical protein
MYKYKQNQHYQAQYSTRNKTNTIILFLKVIGKTENQQKRV